jgi:hypothetical protein
MRKWGAVLSGGLQHQDVTAPCCRDCRPHRAARDTRKVRRCVGQCVGPQRAGEFGLRTQVDETEARQAVSRQETISLQPDRFRR